jgi:hypothetical protein
MRAVRETLGVATAGALTALAMFFVPVPNDLEAVFRVSAVVSGSIGYWISRQTSHKPLSLAGVLGTSAAILVLIPVSAIYYVKYLHVPTPDVWQDILGFMAFEIFFATICFLLGSLYGNFLGSGGGSDPPQP